MRKLVCVVLALCLCVGCASCSSTPKPEKALAKMLDHLVDYKISKAEKLVYEGTLNVNDKKKKSKAIYKAMFSSITYTISGSTTDGDASEVAVSITMIDMETLLLEASLESLETGFDSLLGDNTRFYNLVSEKIQEGNLEYVTTSVTAYMIYEDGAWKVRMGKSSGFADAITGGVGELIGY